MGAPSRARPDRAPGTPGYIGPVRLAVLVSGSGTILQAMFEAGLPVAVVLADRECAGLDIAAAHGVPAELVARSAHGGFGAGFDRDAYSAVVAETLIAHETDL